MTSCTTSPRRLAAVVSAALAAGLAAAAWDAATAHAATIGPQERVQSSRFAVEFPGRRYRKGGPVPRGHVVVRRRVALGAREAPVRTALVCPTGTYAHSPSLSEPAELGIRVEDVSQYRRKVRRFRLQVYASPLVERPTATGRVYLLCRPR